MDAGHKEADRSRWQPVVITFFPMAIAMLSLLTSIYNGYLNNRFVDLIENNVSRVEYMRTCKEIIDAYFLVKAKAGALTAADSEGVREFSRERIAAGEAVARFGALGTYLANLRDEKVRERYTHLTWAVEKAVATAPLVRADGLAKVFERADQEFGALNDDCVKSAKAKQM